MKIGTTWKTNVRKEDLDELLALITSGDQEYNPKTGMMVEQYKEWTSDLAVEELERVIALLGRGRDIGKSDIPKLEQELAERRDPVRAEQLRLALQARREELARTEERLLGQGLEALGGTGDTWDGRRDRIDTWWRAVKAAEAAETWATAFSANRMTARQVNSNSILGGRFGIRNAHHRRDRSWDREIVLDRTLDGVRKRMQPANFHDPATGANRKNELGLHDLSASLLDGSRTPMSVHTQLKPYEDATVVFMPVPTERDAQIFNAIQSLTPVTEADREQVRRMRNRFTRLRMAQATDMHTYLLNVNEVRDGEPLVRYGHSGRVRRPGDRAEVRADEIDIATRRTNALEHGVILRTNTDQVVNEVVVVYREHASALFPVFARWDGVRSRFVVLDRRTNERTKACITNEGTWVGWGPRADRAARAGSRRRVIGLSGRGTPGTRATAAVKSGKSHQGEGVRCVISRQPCGFAAPHIATEANAVRDRAVSRAEGSALRPDRREARVTSGPHSGQLLIATLDESDSVIAVFYEEEEGGLTFVADYWFATFEDLEAGVAEAGWEVAWLP
ncbi:hypothetical protein ACIGNX_29715 [Actinosynnema sp. NPDC053489]|uniref:hypothetical protein n=1 Tax=Actinosynnema sp. NPDC053489 TaxID=3363916 RepID=UPI0037CB44D8